MIVYSASKVGFRQDIMSNDIEQIIVDAFFKVTGKHTSKSEMDSWRNSLQFMDRVVSTNDIPDDAGIAIEYHIPQSSKRIDFILSGQNADNEDTAILVELKAVAGSFAHHKRWRGFDSLQARRQRNFTPIVSSMVIPMPSRRL